MAMDAESPAISHQLLHRYDFSFWAWPVDYRWRNAAELRFAETSRMTDVRPPPVTDLDESDHHGTTTRPPDHRRPGWLRRRAHLLLDYVAAHTIGRRMLYPGSVGLMKALLKFALDQGRAKLFEEHNARRYKLQTASNRSIETAFIDKRGQSLNGDTLVVACEGNAGYLEIGVMQTPLEKGYSALGWNHPGFGGSEGLPWPDQEREAIEVVVQFALEELNFRPAQVVLVGWSIGGFTATWAVSQYPRLGGLFLDATFDDVVPLALSRMPGSWDRLVRHTIRKYLNLPIARQLQAYAGPVRFIRRRRDEVISTTLGGTMAEQQATNRGNDLLVDFLSYRYPLLVPQNAQIVLDWLHADDRTRLLLLTSQAAGAGGSGFESLRAHLRAFVEDNRQYRQEKSAESQRGVLAATGGQKDDVSAAKLLDDGHAPADSASGGSDSNPFPCLIGPELNGTQQRQLTLFLTSFYMEDFDNTHCTPLEARLFETPVHPWELED